MHYLFLVQLCWLAPLFMAPNAFAFQDISNSASTNFKSSLESDSAAAYGKFRDSINSQENGPLMTIIPAGSFTMGSAESESGRYPDESPAHQVTFEKPFALGVTEVTVAEFAKFVRDTDYKTDAENYGGSWLRNPDVQINDWMVAQVDWRKDHLGLPSRPDNPVIHVTWNDAKAYVAWLSKTTGKNYRLPSEAEFEYANRAGSQTQFWWGDESPTTPVANLRGTLEQSITPPQIWSFTNQERSYAVLEGPTWYAFPNYNDGYGGIAPVASFSVNAFNLYDTTGNVWEWTEDCYVNSYKEAPTDGSARTDKECSTHVVRGGSFYCFPRHMRSANRWSRLSYTRGIYIGFRVARDI